MDTTVKTYRTFDKKLGTNRERSDVGNGDGTPTWGALRGATTFLIFTSHPTELCLIGPVSYRLPFNPSTRYPIRAELNGPPAEFTVRRVERTFIF